MIDGFKFNEREKIVEAYHRMCSVSESSVQKRNSKSGKCCRRAVNEGAGAGYTVHIKDLKLGKILEVNLVKGKERYDDYHKVKVEIVPGEYEIGAEDYYDDFFWQEHELGEPPTANIGGGVATVAYSCNSYDDKECMDELERELVGREIDVSFDYGWGWVHADLPREMIESDHVNIDGDNVYFGIDRLELIAPDLADAVNSGHDSIFEREDDDEMDTIPESVKNGMMKKGCKRVCESAKRNEYAYGDKVERISDGVR